MDDTNNVSSEELQKYFSELNTTLFPQKFNSPELKEEVLTKINKGTSPDSMKNEMLRCARGHITKHIVSIFNNIPTTGIYPTAWKTSFIKPVHKKGSKDSATNFRGISLQINFGKLFAILLKVNKIYLRKSIRIY